MSDPFIDLNKLKTSHEIHRNSSHLMASNRLQQQMSNQSISKPLLSPHLPQLPQQQIRTPFVGSNQRSVAETGEEERDERKRFERNRKFQIQQKRLQEMSFVRTGGQTQTKNSSADHLIANLIQKVETEAKLDKRIHNSHPNVVPQAFHPLMASNVPFIAGSVQTPNTSSSYVSQYPNVSQNPLQPMIVTNDRQRAQQLNNTYMNTVFPQTNGQTYGQQNQSLNSTPILQELMTTNSSSAENHNYSAFNPSFGQPVRPESAYNYCNNFSPQMTSNQSMTSYNTNSDPIFSITTNSNVNTEPNPMARQSPLSPKLPVCFQDMSKMPELYIKVWNYVKLNEMSNVCDTNKLYPVLLSVGLPQTVLAQLWSIVNHTIPGQLTYLELFMTLALIALIQKNSLNPLEEVYKLDSLPIPTINFGLNETNGAMVPNNDQNWQKSSEPEIQHFEQTLNTNKCEQNSNDLTLDYKSEQNLSKLCQKLENTPTDDIIDDDFDDFKSADFTSVSNDFQSNNVFIEKNSLNPPVIGIDTNEDEFDDFKSAPISESIQSIASLNASKVETNCKPKTNRLSDALMSNISAMSSTNSSSTSIPNPIFSISLVNSLNSGQNTCESSPISAVSPESLTDSNSGSVDRYSVFRVLSAENQSKKSDDFGEFLSYNTSNCDAESVDSLQFGHQDNDNDSIDSISQQIIQICRQLIHKAFNVLVVNHGESSVLEAMRANDGIKFAFDLMEVYSIAKRVAENLKSNDKLNDYTIKLIDDIDNTWNSINSVFIKASLNIEFKEEKRSQLSDDSSHCAICCSKASPELPVITFAGYEYHTSCANLWLNCINPTLPQPLIQFR